MSAWSARATAVRAAMAGRALPFWYDDAFVDSPRGYRLGYDARRGRFDEPAHLIVSQARLLWVFARAHRLGHSADGPRDYLRAARHGFAHLQADFHDRLFGGYAWQTTPDGLPLDARKVLYGNAFALYALVEYARAAEDPAERAAATEAAVALFRTLEAPAATPDATRPLALAEIAERNFAAPSTLARGTIGGVCAAGYRCANTVLHWMEALTELYALTRDPQVRASLLASVEMNATHFYPADLARGVYYLPREAGIPAWPDRPTTSYGHNVEFAWLRIDAQRALGVEPDVAGLEAIVDHALRHGFDGERGGMMNAGYGDAPAHDRDKTWWPQAEILAALTYLIASGHASRSYDAELKLLLDWYEGPHMHPATGNPYAAVAHDGARVLDATISGQWQAAYHDLRARWIFVDAFAD